MCAGGGHPFTDERDPGFGQELNSIQQLLRAEQKRVRDFVSGWDRKNDSKDFVLVSACEGVLTELSVYWHCETPLRVFPVDARVPSVIAENLWLILAEAIANAVKHGGATRDADRFGANYCCTRHQRQRQWLRLSRISRFLHRRSPHCAARRTSLFMRSCQRTGRKPCAFNFAVWCQTANPTAGVMTRTTVRLNWLLPITNSWFWGARAALTRWSMPLVALVAPCPVNSPVPAVLLPRCW
jgi:hypothetical protein